MPELWTVKKTAEYFEVTERCIHDWCTAKKLDKVRISPKCVRITSESVLRLIKESR